MSKRGDNEFLADIKESIARTLLYIEGISYEEFLNSIKTQDAVVRNLEIIGEAAKNLSDNFAQKYSEIPWQQLARLRDRLIHFYFGVNYDIVWSIITEEIPEIARQIHTIAP
jgi:uncharacterized protein with HEPN domain